MTPDSDPRAARRHDVSRRWSESNSSVEMGLDLGRTGVIAGSAVVLAVLAVALLAASRGSEGRADATTTTRPAASVAPPTTRGSIATFAPSPTPAIEGPIGAQPPPPSTTPSTTRGPRSFDVTDLGPIAESDAVTTVWGVIGRGGRRRVIGIDLRTGAIKEPPFPGVPRAIGSADGELIAWYGASETTRWPTPDPLVAVDVNETQGARRTAVTSRWSPTLKDWTPIGDPIELRGEPLGVDVTGELLVRTPDNSVFRVTERGHELVKSEPITAVDQGRIVRTSCPPPAGVCQSVVAFPDGSLLPLRPIDQIVWLVSIAPNDARVIRVFADGLLEVTERDGSNTVIGDLDPGEYQPAQIAWTPDGIGLIVVDEGLLVVDGDVASVRPLPEGFDPEGADGLWLEVIGLT